MKKKSKTDWDRVKTMKDLEIDYSDISQLDKDFFKKAVLCLGLRGRSLFARSVNDQRCIT
jgi:hypothetical protein